MHNNEDINSSSPDRFLPADESNMEARLWVYMDGLSDEASFIEKLIADNEEWRAKYAELQEVHQLMKASELEQPSLRFTKNIMEDSYTAKKVMVTVPVGVLQNGAITFLPSIPAIQGIASQLGFGHVLKINFLFSDAFWKNKELTNEKDLDDLNFLFSEEEIPTWWTQHPQKENVLTGWLGGPKARAMQIATDEEIIQKALSSLCRIFNIDVLHLQQKLQETKFYNWSADPHFSGAYSYAVVNGKEYIQKLLQPVENTIYFAGEGLHDSINIGTVEAALVSGKDVAQRLVAEF